MRFVLALLALLAPLAPPPPLSPLITGARQMVLVITPGWNNVRGELRRFDRASSSEPWRAAGDSISIVVGKNGIAWDPLADPIVPGPIKTEGDGRSPAGVFSLGSAFGYAPSAEAGWLKLPYLHVTEGVECVDDASSSVYNQIVNRRTVASPDWKSAEKMREVGEAYRWGVVVNYNTPAVSTRGSCIFLHSANLASGGSDQGTAGCTAMAQTDLHGLMAWIDPKVSPVLVQLPRVAYEKVKADWPLP